MMGTPGMGRITAPAQGAPPAVNVGGGRSGVGARMPMGKGPGPGVAGGASAGAVLKEQPLLRANVPKGFSMQPGQTMWGQVAGRKGQFFTLQFGKFTLSARSQLPLVTGQQIHVAFGGRTQGNQVSLQLLQTATFSKMSSEDLTQALTQMKLPVNEGNMAVARGLVEFGIPLTSQNVGEFSRVMASLPGPVTTTDMAAASFLKMANVPLTPANVQVVSNFIAQHPLLGAQLFEMQKAPGSPGKDDVKGIQREMEVLEEISKTAGKYVVDPARQEVPAQARNLRNLAREEGVESIRYGVEGSDMEDGWELMRLLREIEGLPGGKDSGSPMARFTELAQSARENLQAHHLINSSRPQSDLAFYYLQVPLLLNREETTAEIRIGYFEEEDQSKWVDPENTRIEFDVCTDSLGAIHVDLMVKKGLVYVNIGTDSVETEEFLGEFIPLLEKTIDEMGYEPRRLETGLMEEGTGRPLISREEFESLERIDVQT